MRYVLFTLLCLTLTAYAYALPTYQGYVTDQAKLFSPAEQMQLEQVLTQIEQNTTAEVAVVTVDSLEGLAIEDYSIKLAEEWKVGKKDLDNGLIILIAPNERKYRVEVGYGLEGTLPDSLTGRLGREILVPAFRSNQYGQGVLELVKTLQGYLENNPEIISRHEVSTFNQIVMWFIVMVFILNFGLIFYHGIKN
ncbi:MAG: TPM domain-containing protein, partial [Nanoarchaeota archaeon]